MQLNLNLKLTLALVTLAAAQTANSQSTSATFSFGNISGSSTVDTSVSVPGGAWHQTGAACEMHGIGAGTIQVSATQNGGMLVSPSTTMQAVFTPGSSSGSLSASWTCPYTNTNNQTMSVTFNTSGTYTATPVGLAGFINPKYVVVGVMYAPPGSSSYAQYSNTNSTGNTTMIGKSFSSNTGFSVSTTNGTTIKAAQFASGAVKLTATESTDYTQGSSSSTTSTVSTNSNFAYKLNGTPTESPVNHDYDYMLIWINPELLMTYVAPVGSNPASLTLTGYAFDPYDPVSGLPPASGPYISGPDVLEVQVGCLNGHISCPSTLTWENNVEGPGSYVSAGVLTRSWQSAANGYQWPSGEMSALTFNDVCQILSFDPLATSPSTCPAPNDYALLNSLPSTTTDGRYTKIPYPPNPIQYPVGGGNEMYSLVQTNTQSESTGNSTQIKQAFSVSESFSTSWISIFTSTTMTESQTLTWNYSSLSTLTTSDTVTDALSVTGPPDSPAYDGPVEFIGYQDNTFGTYLFAPVD